MPHKLTIPRWQKMLIEIRKAAIHNRYGSHLIRILGGSRTHIRHILSKLERHGLVFLKRRRNRKIIGLTQRGERIAQAVMDMQGSIHTH